MKFFVEQFRFENWGLVLLYALLATGFIYGLLRPKRRTEWRSAGIAWAWVIALYAEMYGLPLTLYLLSAILGPDFAPTDFQRGHLWPQLLGLESATWSLAFAVAGNLLIAAGALLALAGWRTLYRGRDRMVTEGIYQFLRHPQYVGFFLFILGSIVNWPTLPTLLMAPLLLLTYYRLALKEEQEALERFGQAYQDYASQVGRFWPRARR